MLKLNRIRHKDDHHFTPFKPPKEQLNDRLFGLKWFASLVVSPPRAGKTTIICNIIKKNYGGYFDKIFLFVASGDDTFDALGLPKERYVSSMSEMPRVLDAIRAEFKGSKHADTRDVLFVVDDCLAEFQDKKIQKKFFDLIINRRHPKYKCSVFFSVQDITTVPSHIKKQFDVIIMPPNLTPLDLSNIRRHYFNPYGLKNDEFNSVYIYCTTPDDDYGDNTKTERIPMIMVKGRKYPILKGWDEIRETNGSIREKLGEFMDLKNTSKKEEKSVLADTGGEAFEAMIEKIFKKHFQK